MMKKNFFKQYIYFYKIFYEFTGRRLWIFIGLTMLVAFSEVVGITMLLPLLESMQVKGEAGSKIAIMLKDFLEFMHIPQTVNAILAVMVVIFLLKGVLKIVEGWVKGSLIADLLRKLKKKLFYYYSFLRFDYYASKNTGHFINVINPQIQRFLMGFESMAMVTTSVVTSLVYLLIAFFVSPVFSLMAVAGGIIIFSILKYVNRYTWKISVLNSQENSSLNKFLVQTLHAMKYLKATARFGQLKKDLENSIDKLAGYRFRMTIAKSLVLAAKEPFIIAFIVGIILVQTMYFGEPVSGIMVTVLLFYRGMNKLTMVQQQWQIFMTHVGGIEMVKDEFEIVKNKQEEPGEQQLQQFQTEICFENVSFAYEKTNVLENINIRIPKNKTIGFVGESGAGKSTLFDILTLIQPINKGKLMIDDISSEDILKKSWREKIGYITQDVVVFDDTIANNICLWAGNFNSDKSIKEKVIQMAKMANLHNFIEEQEKGYNTIIGDKGVKLSGGQRQRLAIARELYKEPQLLLLDEATSALDTKSEKNIQHSIDALKGKTTILIIAHRLSTIRNVDYLYVLDQGKVIEEGTYEDLKQKGSELNKMIELQDL
ncbi:MAG: ABC transporter ATP-binding protein [Bacteroidota bacterium]